MDKRRRKGFIILTVSVILLLALVLGLVFGLAKRQKTEEQTLKQTFLQRCEKSNGKDCQNIWKNFTQAYVGRDPCQVPQEAYDPLIAAAPFKPACNRTMLWSKTKNVVHDFTNDRECFTTLEKTLLGSILDGLTWCGKNESEETFTTGCPGWSECETNPVRSFWYRASAAFAEVACGDVTAMLNGSISKPFATDSIFGKIEVKRLNSAKVPSLNVVLVTQKNPETSCTNPSLTDLKNQLKLSGIAYGCKEVAESRIRECGSNSQIQCGACW